MGWLKVTQLTHKGHPSKGNQYKGYSIQYLKRAFLKGTVEEGEREVWQILEVGDYSKGKDTPKDTYKGYTHSYGHSTGTPKGGIQRVKGHGG